MEKLDMVERQKNKMTTTFICHSIKEHMYSKIVVLNILDHTGAIQQGKIKLVIDKSKNIFEVDDIYEIEFNKI